MDATEAASDGRGVNASWCLTYRKRSLSTGGQSVDPIEAEQGRGERVL